MKKSVVKGFSVSVSILLAGFVAIYAGFSGEYCGRVVYASADVTERTVIDLPIVMYHKVLKGSKGKYVVSPEQLENDFIAIKEAGFTSVHLREVIDWVDGKGSLPEKPIVLTFDDGHYNNMHYAYPIAQKHGIKFNINPVTSFSKHSVDHNDTSNPNYSHLSWDQMRELCESGVVEFGNHTHAMHAFRPRFGIAAVSGEPTDVYVENLRKDINIAQEWFEKSGVVRPTTFAYPFGKYTPEGKQLLKEMGFRALLTCNEGINQIDKNDPWRMCALRRYNRDGHWTTENLMAKINPIKIKN